jgi:hypothetical protein
MNAILARTSAGRRLAAGTGALVILAMVASLSVVPVMSSATLTSAWQAKLGSSGVSGTATVRALDTGTGSVILKLAKLKASTTLPVRIHKGTCGSVGAVLLTLPAIRTTSAGAASRTSTLTATQIKAVKAATVRGSSDTAVTWSVVVSRWRFHHAGWRLHGVRNARDLHAEGDLPG